MKAQRFFAGNVVQSCQFAKMSCAVMFGEHVDHDAFSHVSRVQEMCPVLHCMLSARVREKELRVMLQHCNIFQARKFSSRKGKLF